MAFPTLGTNITRRTPRTWLRLTNSSHVPTAGGRWFVHPVAFQVTAGRREADTRRCLLSLFGCNAFWRNGERWGRVGKAVDGSGVTPPKHHCKPNNIQHPHASLHRWWKTYLHAASRTGIGRTTYVHHVTSINESQQARPTSGARVVCLRAADLR